MTTYSRLSFLIFSIFLISSTYAKALIQEEATTQSASIKTLIPSIVINEVSPSFDWIELTNNSDQTIDLKGYSFTHKDGTEKYTINKKKKIKPGKFYVLHKKSKTKIGYDFFISKKGDIQLYSPENILIDSIDLSKYNIPKNGSIGRFPNGSGAFIEHYITTEKKENRYSTNNKKLIEIKQKFTPYKLEDSHKSEVIFDQNTLQRFDLWLEDEALEYLDQDPAKEEYVYGALVHNNKVLSNIGVRYKGSVGAFVECVSGRNPMKPSGKKKCTKLSMKVKINWIDKKQTFYGLTKLQFHSQNLDPSKMHERLGYWLYNQFGVPAPRSIHAKLYINGKYNGIYALTEQIDQSFINRHFKENNEGNLYKEVWPLKSTGDSNTEQDFINALKTNEKESNVSNFSEFSSELESIPKEDSEQLKAFIKKWFDVDSLLRSLVVDRNIRADDGIFHWYCSTKTKCFNHNYYWYQQPNKKVHLIHWDLDNAFENLGEPKNPVTNIEHKWNETVNDCEGLASGPFYIIQKSAACDKLIYAFTLFEKEFIQFELEFKKTLFNEKTITPLLEKWQNQINDAVIEASQSHDDQISLENWKQAVQKLNTDILNSID